MAGINELIALGGPGLQRFDASAFGTSVEDLRAKQLANQTGAFNLQQGQDRKTALEEYNRLQRSGSPDAINALNTQPEAMTSIVAARNAMSVGERAQFDHVLGHRARAANAVAQFPAGSPERLKAWNEQLNELLANKAIDSAQFKRLHGTEPTDMLLQQYIAAGLQVPQFMEYGIKRAGIAAADQFGRAVGQALGGDAGASSPAPTSQNERRVIQSESGGKPDAVNPFGFAGTYQFGAPRLSALGLYQPGPGENLQTWNRTYKSAPAKWSGEFRIPGHPDVKTFADFLANPAAQKRAYDLHREGMGQEITDNGFDKYIGTKVGGVLITQAGLENMLHLGGVRGTKRTLESDGKDSPADANGKTPLDYARMAPQGTAESGAAVRETPGAGTPSFVQRLLPLAMAAQATPGVPESTAKLASTIIDWAKEESKPTELGKNYDDYARDERASGRVPMSRLEFNIRTVGPRGMNVAVDTKAESAEAAARGGGIAKRLNEIAEKGDEAYAQRDIIARLGEKLEESGTGADIAFANWARENFGEKIGGIFTSKKKLEAAEAASALINFLKPRMRVAGTGASSDKDLDAFARAIPSLLSTAGGKRIIVETLGGIQQALVDRGDIATRYQTGEISAADAFKNIRGLSDPFAGFREYQKAQEGRAGAGTTPVPRFRTMEEVLQAVEEKKIEPGQSFWVKDDKGNWMVGEVPQPTARAPTAAPSAPATSPEPPAPLDRSGAIYGRSGRPAPVRTVPEAEPFEVPH